MILVVQLLCPCWFLTTETKGDENLLDLIPTFGVYIVFVTYYKPFLIKIFH